MAASLACDALADVTAGIAALEAGNVSVAVEQFRAEFDDGDADGAFNCGLSLVDGQDVDEDPAKAVTFAKPSVVRMWSQDHLVDVSVGADIIVNNQATLQKLGGTRVGPA